MKRAVTNSNSDQYEDDGAYLTKISLPDHPKPNDLLKKRCNFSVALNFPISPSFNTLHLFFGFSRKASSQMGASFWHNVLWGGGGGGGGKEWNHKRGHVLKDPGEHTMMVLIQCESLSDGCLHWTETAVEVFSLPSIFLGISKDEEKHEKFHMNLWFLVLVSECRH